MNPEVKKMWLEDLRSGKFPQGIGCLLKDGKYCCLGVLTERYHTETGIGEWRDKETQFSTQKRREYCIPNQFRESLGLPLAAKLWAGIMGDSDHNYLVRMNDEGHSFAEIADWIEEHL